jgi:hypothetical protein
MDPYSPNEILSFCLLLRDLPEIKIKIESAKGMGSFKKNKQTA